MRSRSVLKTKQFNRQENVLLTGEQAALHRLGASQPSRRFPWKTSVRPASSAAANSCNSESPQASSSAWNNSQERPEPATFLIANSEAPARRSRSLASADIISETPKTTPK